MSKRKDIIRVGDRVKILKPEVVVRVGYPLCKTDMMKAQTPEQLKAIQDMFKAFNVRLFPEKLEDYASPPSSRRMEILYEKIRYAMAGEMLSQNRFGGRERRIHTHTIPHMKGLWATVDARRVVKTGNYEPGWSGCDYWGEYDCEPAYLSDEKTHVLYKLYVDGIGGHWSPDSEDLLTEYKDIEIESCNLVKIDPKNPPTDDEDEHPSGLSGEHSVVLDAIHQECLHGR